MHSTKIQDQVEPVVGVYKGPVKGKHKKSDFVVETLNGPIKILGVTDLANKLSVVTVGTEVMIKYDKTIQLSNGHDFILVEVHVLG